MKAGERAWRSASFYGLIGGMLITIIAIDLTNYLPETVALRLEQSGEIFMFTLAICAHIQFVRPWLQTRSRMWAATFAVAALYLLVALFLHRSGLFPASIWTLNEAFVALAGLAVYFQLRRPLRWPLAYSAGVLIIIVVFFDNRFGTDWEMPIILDQSEALALLFIAPIAFDIADPRILDPRARDRPLARAIWCVFLAVSWFYLTFFVANPGTGWTTLVSNASDYVNRAEETLLGLLLAHVYFSYWLERKPIVQPAYELV